MRLGLSILARGPRFLLGCVWLVTWATVLRAEPETTTPAARLVGAISDPRLVELLGDVLERNPELAEARAGEEAALLMPPQVSSLPDPMAGVTTFVAPPETRLGPQFVMGVLSQKLPWFGKRRLRGEAARQHARALSSGVEARRLHQVTEVRRLYHEIAFLDALDAILRTDGATLSHYEELARARYASGVGMEAGVVKIQAELTKVDARRLEAADGRARLLAQLNALRDRPADTPLPELTLPDVQEIPLDLERLRAVASSARPELEGAQAHIDQAAAEIELARKAHRPDVTLGLTYTWVRSRTDPGAAGLPDNGKDILGVSASINLPVRKKRIKAGVEQAAKHEWAAREQHRAVAAGIERLLGELVARARLTWQRLRLLESSLAIQAAQALSSAEAGYSAGALGALDLLDAERVQLDVKTAVARARADYVIVLARLEGAVGASLTVQESKGGSQ